MGIGASRAPGLLLVVLAGLVEEELPLHIGQIMLYCSVFVVACDGRDDGVGHVRGKFVACANQRHPLHAALSSPGQLAQRRRGLSQL
jgi:hypothetical protein